MAEQNSNNENRILTSKFGDLLENNIDAAEIEDPFFEVLSEAKQDLLSDAVDAPGKNNVWEQISSGMQKAGKSRKARILNLTSVQKWAVAATVIIAAFIGVYNIFFAPQEELLFQTAEAKDTVILQDGSEVILRPYSKLYEIAQNEDDMAFRIEGEGYFDVTKSENRQFAVIANNGKVTVLGTRFNVSTWGEQVQVFLEEGSIEFENRQSGEQVVLSPGEFARISERVPLEVKKIDDPEEFTDWKTDKLVFKNQELSTIINELEQQFNVTVTLTEDLNSVTLSGELTLNSPQQALDYLALTLEGSFEKISDDSYRFIPTNN